MVAGFYPFAVLLTENGITCVPDDPIRGKVQYKNNCPELFYARADNVCQSAILDRVEPQQGTRRLILIGAAG
jgi:hypothetical protein